MKQLKIVLVLAVMMAAIFMPMAVTAAGNVQDVAVFIESRNALGAWEAWHKGERNGWLEEVNPNALSPIQMAEAYLQVSGLAEEWRIVSPYKDNVVTGVVTYLEPAKAGDKATTDAMVYKDYTAITIRVEPIYTIVDIYHHALYQEPQIYSNQAQWTVDDQLTAERVPTTWATNLFGPGVKYDSNKTVVTPIYMFDLSIGQNVFQGYVVDMYYLPTVASVTAQEPAHDVAAAQSARVLPATGAAGVSLLSVLLTALGIAIRRAR